MVLGEVIGIVFEASAPVDEEITLGDAVFDPVEAHVDGFGAALFDGIIGNTGGAGIICLDGRGGLRVTHIFQGGAKGGAVFTVVEEGAELGLSGGGEDRL